MDCIKQTKCLVFDHSGVSSHLWLTDLEVKEYVELGCAVKKTTLERIISIEYRINDDFSIEDYALFINKWDSLRNK